MGRFTIPSFQNYYFFIVLKLIKYRIARKKTPNNFEWTTFIFRISLHNKHIWKIEAEKCIHVNSDKMKKDVGYLITSKKNSVIKERLMLHQITVVSGCCSELKVNDLFLWMMPLAYVVLWDKEPFIVTEMIYIVSSKLLQYKAHNWQQIHFLFCKGYSPSINFLRYVQTNISVCTRKTIPFKTYFHVILVLKP